MGFVSLLVLNEREESVVVLHLSNGLLKTCSGLEPVTKCAPFTYQPIGQQLNHCTFGAGVEMLSNLAG